MKKGIYFLYEKLTIDKKNFLLYINIILKKQE